MGMGIKQRVMLFALVLNTSQIRYLKHSEKQNTLMYVSFKVIHQSNGILTRVINSLVKHAHYTK